MINTKKCGTCGHIAGGHVGPYLICTTIECGCSGYRQADETAPVLEENRKRSIGGAPTRATTLPTDSAARKQHPIATGVLDYFPDAFVALSKASFLATEQHHPDKPIHWDRSKSGDESDTMMRHFLQRGTIDTDGVRHSTKMAWRALAILQKEIESEQDAPK